MDPVLNFLISSGSKIKGTQMWMSVTDKMVLKVNRVEITKSKVKQSNYRSGKALRVPGG
jgi:hypothetical protein